MKYKQTCKQIQTFGAYLNSEMLFFDVSARAYGESNLQQQRQLDG